VISESNIDGSIFIYIPRANTVYSDEYAAGWPDSKDTKNIPIKGNTLLVH